MAGFMSGFGDAFSKSYGAERDRTAAKEADAFKYTFQIYLDRKKKRDEYATEDKKLVSSAQTLVQSTGLPAEAVGDAYTMLKAGYSLGDVEKRLTSGSWKKPEKPSNPDAVSKPGEPPLSGPDAAGGAGSPGTAVASPAGSVAPEMAQTEGALAPPGPIENPMGPEGRTTPLYVGKKGEFPPASDPNAPPIDPAVAKQQATGGAVEMPESILGAKTGSSEDRMRNAAIDKIAETTGQTREQIEADMATVDETVPSMQPSGAFTPGPPALDWMTDEEAVYRRDQAIAEGNKGQAAHYQKIVDAHNEVKNKQAVRDNPQGTRIARIRNADGTIDTKAVQQTEDGQWMRMDTQEVLEQTPEILTDAELKLRDALTDNTPETIDYSKKIATSTSLMREGGQIYTMLEIYPDAASGAAKLAASVVDLSAEAQAAIGILNGDNSDDPAAANAAMDILEAESSKLDEMISHGVIDAATASRLIRSKLVLMSYRAGGVEGIRGRDVTEKEYNRMYEVITGNATDGPNIQRNLVQYMKGLRANLKTEGKLFNDNNRKVKEYESMFGPGSAPKSAVIGDIDSAMLDDGDPDLKFAHDLMTKGKMEVKPEAAEAKKPADGLPNISSPEDPNFTKLKPGDHFMSTVNGVPTEMVKQ